jgi:hypothetical protein
VVSRPAQHALAAARGDCARVIRGDQQQLREEACQAQEPLRRERLRLWDRRAISKGEPDVPVPPVTLAGLQAVLGPDEAVISYYWLNSLVLLVTTVTASEIVVERKILKEDQRTLLERMIRVMGSLTGSNRSLDTEFIGPLAPVLTPVDGLSLLKGKQRLIVSPHRLLHWYPFAARTRADRSSGPSRSVTRPTSPACWCRLPRRTARGSPPWRSAIFLGGRDWESWAEHAGQRRTSPPYTPRRASHLN